MVKRQDWQPIFSPKVFRMQHPDPTIDAFKLGMDDLMKLGNDISSLRATISNEALRAEGKDAS